MNLKTKYLALIFCTLLGTTSVVILYYWSEKIMHKSNPFIRRYVQGCLKMHQIDMKYNSFYFAGFSENKIFLGNTTAPLKVTSVDSALTKMNDFTIHLDDRNLPFASPVIRVEPPNLYFIDGTVPVIFKGSILSGNVKKKWTGNYRFSHPQIIDSLTLACRTISQRTQTSELALVRFGSKPKFEVHSDLLELQVDGIFDCDGSLDYSKELDKIVYTYLYRNQFVVADPSLRLDYRGSTIDTISIADIDVATVTSRNETKMSRPPLVVNRLSAVDDNLLFVASAVVGQYEDETMWRQSTIIDVYDVLSREYIASFYLYHINGKKARAIAAQKGRFYALIGDQLVFYRLDKLITEQYRKK